MYAHINMHNSDFNWLTWWLDHATQGRSCENSLTRSSIFSVLHTKKSRRLGFIPMLYQLFSYIRNG